MRKVLIALGVVVLLIGAGFGFLLYQAETMEPAREEVRIDVTDALND